MRAFSILLLACLLASCSPLLKPNEPELVFRTEEVSVVKDGSTWTMTLSRPMCIGVPGPMKEEATLGYSDKAEEAARRRDTLIGATGALVGAVGRIVGP